MHLTGMDIRETPPFTELVELDFDARVNVFIGPNASGKSTILKEMDAAFNGDKRPLFSDHLYNVEPEYHPRTARVVGTTREKHKASDYSRVDERNLIFTSEDWYSQGSLTFTTPRLPVVHLGPARTELSELYDEEAATEDNAEVGEVLNRPFSGANFKLANEKMHQKATSLFEHEKKEDMPIDERRARNFGEIYECAYPCVKSICSDVIIGEFPRNYVTGLSITYLDHQPFGDFDETQIHRSMGFTVVDQPNFSGVRPEDRPTYSEQIGKPPLYAGFLSSGTQTTFLWVHWLAYKMLYHYDFAEGWKDKPAILLIDEIENHLHPTWQRRVIPALLEHFPGLQVFATTHSPFVVAGLRSGQVHLLDRNSDGVVTATTTEQDIIGWTTDEILRTFMGVAEPTDELTIERTKRLRELRRKESLTDKEAEELETLRRQVNTDLLSSRSPMEQQHERYADMMLRFIESRRSQLSQDS